MIQIYEICFISIKDKKNVSGVVYNCEYVCLMIKFLDVKYLVIYYLFVFCYLKKLSENKYFIFNDLIICFLICEFKVK